ncbi:MAG: FAD-binding oxidoreductase [Propionibacteriaceae bacterium]|jgi:D-lactate dehydrogenase|nr:FAD-binding oxidoreductase [Propionibacteriaceae bacterium]
MSPTPLAEALAAAGVAGTVRTAEFDRRAAAHDASHFLLLPQAVARPRSAEDVARLLRAAAAAGTGLTFRSGGTSLSGQAGTDRLLVDVRARFQGVAVLDGGARVRVEPGVTVDRVNAHLAPYGRKLGPDPASARACTVGGVVANNSSGMACGTTENTYRTLDSLVVVLPSGTVLDTGAPDADERLRLAEPAVYAGLAQLRDRVTGNPASVATIRQQFSMKNTMGYGLNSFTDFTRPVDILAHLLIGSEGTLGFIASATFRTVPVRSHVQTALVVFDNLLAANSALPGLVAAGAATLELMDATALRVGQALAGTPAVIRDLHVADQAALLVEFQATTADELTAIVTAAQPVLADLPVRQPVTLTADPALRQDLWALRNGLYTAVAGARPPGTTALLEDVVVPVASLAAACTDLAGLFDAYQYRDAVIFGHAKDGNIHFMLTDRFEDAAALGRYRDFTEAMVGVVLGYAGSLKAEHGTGRVMAPFVERQWGRELTEVMRAVKDLIDPRGLLNDNVVLTDDPELHLKHIKAPVAVDPLVDRCVECGYCEPVCPARDLTLTPRQRIAVRREIAAAAAAGERDRAFDLARRYRYDGVQTCAVDALCALNCPLGIDTAQLVKRFRRAQVAPSVSAVWTVAARHWDKVTTAASAALDVAHTPAGPLVRAANRLGRTVLSKDTLPLLSAELPGGGARRSRPAPPGPTAAPAPAGREGVTAVYLPACVNRMFGPAAGMGVQAAFERLCAAAGVTLIVPPGIDGWCCGTVWSSKGIAPGHAAMAERVLPGLAAATDQGRRVAVCDASSCTEGFRHLLADWTGPQIEVLDAVTFTARHLLPALADHPKLPSVTLHVTCSASHLGLRDDLVAVAHAVAEQVHVPIANGCCAFAGDRGLLHPELTAAATAAEAAEVKALASAAHASCNRTCELGLTRATGQPYQHILELLAALV